MKSPDMVKAAPKNCKILFENDQIRIVQVALKPGEKLPLHSHNWAPRSGARSKRVPAANLDFSLAGGIFIWCPPIPAKVQEITPGKEPKVIEIQAGKARFHIGSFEHSIENIGKTPYRSLAIELKQMTELTEQREV